MGKVKDIQIGKVYKRTDDYLKGAVPDYIVIYKIVNPDSILDFTRYRYYDLKSGKQVPTYLTYDDIEGMYELEDGDE